MSLTRKLLSTMGIEDDKVDEIIKAHLDTVNGLKEERDKYKESSDKQDTLQKDYDAVKKELDEIKASNSKSPYKAKYEALEKEKADLSKQFEDYKKEVADKELKAKKVTAYKNLLKKSGVSDKRLDTILKVTDLSSINLEDDGSIKDTEKVEAKIKDEWADFIVTESGRGTNTATPPTRDNSANPKQSRASLLAQKYHANLYGANKKED